MKQHLYPLIFLLVTTSCAHSQDTPQSDISRDSSIRKTLVQGIKYPQLIYTANGEVIGHSEIVARLQRYAEPADELQKYRNGRTGLIVWLGVMLGSGIAAAAERGQGNSGARYTFGGIAVGAVIAAFVSGEQSSLHFDRAIRIYNKRFVP